jgi:hypothetical protein
MKDPLKADVSVKIGGKDHALRFDKRALFRLGDPQYADATGEVDTSNGAALFRRACVYAYCMLIGKGGYATAEDLAADLLDEEAEPLMEAIAQAIQIAQPEGEDSDPLSKSGLSPDEG